MSFMQRLKFPTLESFRDYLVSPVDKKMNLDWTTMQLLYLVNRRASRCWYESRKHLYQGVWRSLLCTLGLVYLIRIDLIDDDENMGTSRVFTLHGFRSVENAVKRSRALLARFNEEVNADKPEEARMHYYQTFVAGYNVVDDFMNGSFLPTKSTWITNIGEFLCRCIRGR